jgi:hypothetical protein
LPLTAGGSRAGQREPGRASRCGTVSSNWEHRHAALLFGAGFETTTHLLPNGLVALLDNPDRLELLTKDPRPTPGAVEELLRYHRDSLLPPGSAARATAGSRRTCGT